MIIILSILITMLLLTIGLNIGIKDFKKLRGIVEDVKLTETIKKFPSNTEICKQTLKKLNYKIQLYSEIVEGKRKDFTEEI